MSHLLTIIMMICLANSHIYFRYDCDCDSAQVRTYVNGTLYSVLTRRALKERAHEIGLPDSLKLLIEHSDETFATQINFILEQLENEAAEEDEGAQSDDEGAEEEEETEADDDADDEDDEEVCHNVAAPHNLRIDPNTHPHHGPIIVHSSPRLQTSWPPILLASSSCIQVDVFPESMLPLDASGGVSGEELLVSRYIATTDAAQREADMVRSSIDAQQLEQRRRQEAADAMGDGLAPTPGGELATRRRHHPDEPLQRPTTPRAPGAPGTGSAGESGEYPLPGELPPPPGTEEEGAEATGGVASKAKAMVAKVSYPDPSSVDETLGYVPVSNRLPRTPLQKTRPAPGGTGAPPLQPTAGGPRAPVERLQRRPPQAQQPPAGQPGGSGSVAS